MWVAPRPFWAYSVRKDPGSPPLRDCFWSILADQNTWIALITERRFTELGRQMSMKFKQHMVSLVLRHRLVVAVVGNASDIVVGPARRVLCLASALDRTLLLPTILRSTIALHLPGYLRARVVDHNCPGTAVCEP